MFSDVAVVPQIIQHAMPAPQRRPGDCRPLSATVKDKLPQSSWTILGASNSPARPAFVTFCSQRSRPGEDNRREVEARRVIIHHMSDEQQRTDENSRERSLDRQYSLSIEQTADLYAHAGHPR